MGGCGGGVEVVDDDGGGCERGVLRTSLGGTRGMPKMPWFDPRFPECPFHVFPMFACRGRVYPVPSSLPRQRPNAFHVDPPLLTPPWPPVTHDTASDASITDVERDLKADHRTS